MGKKNKRSRFGNLLKQAQANTMLDRPDKLGLPGTGAAPVIPGDPTPEIEGTEERKNIVIQRHLSGPLDDHFDYTGMQTIPNPFVAPTTVSLFQYRVPKGRILMLQNYQLFGVVLNAASPDQVNGWVMAEPMEAILSGYIFHININGTPIQQSQTNLTAFSREGYVILSKNLVDSYNQGIAISINENKLLEVVIESLAGGPPPRLWGFAGCRLRGFMYNKTEVKDLK